MLVLLCAERRRVDEAVKGIKGGVYLGGRLDGGRTQSADWIVDL